MPNNSLFLSTIRLQHPDTYNVRRCTNLRDTRHARAVVDWLSHALAGRPTGVILGRKNDVANALALGLGALMEMNVQSIESTLHMYFPDWKSPPDLHERAYQCTQRTFWLKNITPFLSNLFALPSDRSNSHWMAELIQPLSFVETQFVRPDALQIGEDVMELSACVPNAAMELKYTMVLARYLPCDDPKYFLLPHGLPAREWANLAISLPPRLCAIETEVGVEIVGLRPKHYDPTAPYVEGTWGVSVTESGVFKWILPTAWAGFSLNIRRTQNNAMTDEQGYTVYCGPSLRENAEGSTFFHRADVLTLPGSLLTFHPNNQHNPLLLYQQDDFHTAISHHQYLTWACSWRRCQMPQYLRGDTISTTTQLVTPGCASSKPT